MKMNLNRKMGKKRTFSGEANSFLSIQSYVVFIFNFISYNVNTCDFLF